MAQNDQEKCFIIRLGDLTINSIHHDLHAGVENEAKKSNLRDTEQTKLSNVSDISFANTNLQITDNQMTSGSHKMDAQMTQNATIPKKKLSYSTGARKDRRRWKEEEKRQIASGLYSAEDIPAAVNAARKETKRKCRKEHKLRKARERAARNGNATIDQQSGSAMRASENEEGQEMGSSYEAQLRSQMEDIKLN